MGGEYLLQTYWQAHNKRGGLTRGGVARRALTTHAATYTLAFVPALIWIADQLTVGWAVLTAALLALPHLVIDDGRVGRFYLSHVKGAVSYDVGLASSVVLCLVAFLLDAA
jgi:hypothetical protein